eukprot:460804_1
MMTTATIELKQDTEVMLTSKPTESPEESTLDAPADPGRLSGSWTWKLNKSSNLQKMISELIDRTSISKWHSIVLWRSAMGLTEDDREKTAGIRVELPAEYDLLFKVQQ